MNTIILDLVKSLDAVEFDMTPTQTEQLGKKAASSGGLQNVRSYFGRSWAVQMRIAGAAWTLGVTKKLYVAARFSDMCHLYFTQIGARNFRPDEFNFDKETAEQDLTHSTAGPLLGELTSVIFPNGVTAKPKAAKRRSLRSELEQLRDGVYSLFLESPTAFRQSKSGRRLNVELLGPDVTPEEIAVTIEHEELMEEALEDHEAACKEAREDREADRKEAREDLKDGLTEVDELRRKVHELRIELLELTHLVYTGKAVNFDAIVNALKP